ncbi:MAG: glycine C-acetyltransferase [Spirochaetes bacterium]|nr:glycine C-acetyltransferase [Spirochaetota bacterium]
MRRDFYKQLAGELESLRQKGTYKHFKYNTGALEGRVNIEGFGEEIMLCSNNYLGLANKKEIIKAAHEALDKYGAGASSVRFICGTFDIHRTLEEKVASFLGMEASLTYTSCWAANTACIPALLVEGDTVISDELNHASIIDGCKAVAKGVKRAVYKHSDMASLEEKLKEAADSGAVLVITDGVFSMEGYIAKLPEIIALCKKYNALLMVDDSHATGVIGKTGRGTMEYFNITEGVDIISGTFGKALGGAGGGFIAASKDICAMLVQRSRPHLFSNCLPPVLCAIAMSAVEYLEKNPQIVASLGEKTRYMRQKIQAMGLKPLEGDSAIIPIIIGDTAKAIATSEKMMKEGVFTIGFGFPVVPEGAARIRLQISDALSYEDLDKALAVIKNAVSL